MSAEPGPAPPQRVWEASWWQASWLVDLVRLKKTSGLRLNSVRLNYTTGTELSLARMWKIGKSENVCKTKVIKGLAEKNEKQGDFGTNRKWETFKLFNYFQN